MKTVILPNQRPRSGAALTGHAAFDWILSPWRNRSLLKGLVKRDLGARYRGSALGLAWLVGMPLAMMATYSVVFGGVMRVRFGDGGAGGTVLAIWAGVFLWQVIAESASRAAGILHDNAPYVKRVPFPLALLPLMPLGTALVGAGASLGLYVLVYLLVAGTPPATWALLPLVGLPIVASAAGACWLLACAGTFFRDLKHVVPLALTLLMFLTPVLYPMSAVPPKLAWMAYVNPLAHMFEAIRGLMLDGTVPSIATLAATNVGSFALASLGYATFTRREWEYADVV